MTARQWRNGDWQPLLQRDDLIPLLCRRCYGESIEDLAEAYGLEHEQVVGLIRSHGKIYKNMKAFLGRTPPKCKTRPKMEAGFWKKCNRCRNDFWTESRLIFSCALCKERADWKSGGSDFTTSGVRGLG